PRPFAPDHSEPPVGETERPSELLPCPFCGGTARPTAHLEYSWFAPACKACGVRGPTVRIERGSGPQKLRELMSEADRLWNTRTLDAAPADPVPTDSVAIGSKSADPVVSAE